MDELKACPFCGEPVAIEWKFIEDSEGYTHRHEWIECTGCVRDFWPVSDWNTRPIEDALRAELALAHQTIETQESDKTVQLKELLDTRAQLAEKDNFIAVQNEKIDFLIDDRLPLAEKFIDAKEQLAKLESERNALQAKLSGETLFSIHYHDEWEKVAAERDETRNALEYVYDISGEISNDTWRMVRTVLEKFKKPPEEK